MDPIQLANFLKDILSAHYPKGLITYTLYYYALHFSFKAVEPKISNPIKKVKGRLKSKPSIPEGEKEKEELYTRFLNILIDKLKTPPEANPLDTQEFNIQRNISFLPNLIDSICNEESDFEHLDRKVCLERGIYILEWIWESTPSEDKVNIEKALSPFMENLQKTFQENTQEILRILRGLEERNFINPKITYANYFDAVGRRREEELQRLEHYVALPARELETRLAQPGKEPEWATEAIEKCIHANINAVICGESGSGKTFTFLKLFERFKEKFLNDESHYIPLFVELYKLKDYNFTQLLDGTYLNARISENRYEYEKDKGRYIVFLDGLNEAPDPEEAFRDIRTLGLRCFISTQRTYGFLQGEFDHTMQIQPLEPQQVIDYLCQFEEKFPSRHDAEEFYEALNESLKEEVRRPVNLFFLTAMYNETIRTPRNLGDLLTSFADFVCERTLDGKKGRYKRISKKYQEEVLPLIAFRMCEEKERAISQDWLQKIIDEEFKGNVDFYDFEEQAAKRYWLLKEGEDSSRKQKSYEFTREILRDYFAARYVKKNLPTTELLGKVFPDADGKQAHPIFSSVTEVLCGIVKETEAVKIIKAILPNDPYMAASCFARSSISTLQKNLIDAVNDKIDLYDPRYFPSINRIVQFRKTAVEFYRSNGAESSPDYGRCQIRLGIALWYKLDYDGAIKAYGKALRVYEENGMVIDPNYGTCQMNLGIALGDKLDYDGEIEAYRKALRVYKENGMENHPSYGHCQMNLGLALQDKLDYDGAIEAFGKALGVYEENGMENHPSYGRCQMNLGLALQQGKLDYDGAIEAHRKALRVYEKNGMENHPEYGRCQMNMGAALHYKPDYDGAIEAYRKALRVYEENGMENHPDYGNCQINMGGVLIYKLDYDGAIEAYRKALGVYEKNGMENHPKYGAYQINLGGTLHNKLDYDGAIEAYGKALRVYEENGMENHPDYGLCQMNMGEAYYEKGDQPKAMGHLEQVKRIFEGNISRGSMAGEHPWYKNCLRLIKEYST